jgi:hypothetical protein
MAGQWPTAIADDRLRDTDQSGHAKVSHVLGHTNRAERGSSQTGIAPAGWPEGAAARLSTVCVR